MTLGSLLSLVASHPLLQITRKIVMPARSIKASNTGRNSSLLKCQELAFTPKPSMNWLVWLPSMVIVAAPASLLKAMSRRARIADKGAGDSVSLPPGIGDSGPPTCDRLIEIMRVRKHFE